jgi:AcrR family transcriptional regulator
VTRLSLKERQWQLREAMIIDETEALLLEQGYEAMSMDEVAAKVGISKATLYQHFSSKEDLAVNVIVRGVRNTLESLQSETGIVKRPLERLVGALRTTLLRRLKFGQAGSSLPAQVIKKHPRYQAAIEEMTTIIEQVIDQAKRDGCVNPNLKTAIIVPMVATLVQSDLEDILQHSQSTPEELLDTMIHIIMYGFVTSSIEPTNPVNPGDSPLSA